MADVRVNLLDGDEELVRVETLDTDRAFEVNDYFESADGGLYLVAEVKQQGPEQPVELTAVWIDGPPPRNDASRPD